MLFLLEAKAFPDDERSSAAREVKFWLKPGNYSVGRSAGQADIDVIDDKSISRKHAELVVPTWDELQEGEQPYVLLRGATLQRGCIACRQAHPCWPITSATVAATVGQVVLLRELLAGVWGF